MSRNLDTSLKTALQADVVLPRLLIKADFDSGTVYLWSGNGDLSWDGQTWSGASSLLHVTSMEEGTEIKANGTNIVLSGIPSDMLSLALSEQYQGRSVVIYLGAIDSSNTFVTDPIILFRGFMDIMSINESAETATIGVTVENRLIDFERPRVFRYTSEDQKIKYPDDLGFDFVNDLQDKKIRWGSGG
jgi:hypothetical protein